LQINEELLHKLKVAVKKNFDSYFEKVLVTSAQHGAFGMDLLDKLHDELPATRCSNCGKCCNSVSIFSLEFHRIIRDLMAKCDPEKLRKFIFSAFRFDLRQAEVGTEKRIRCTFRDDEKRVCLVHPVRAFPCRIFGLLKTNGKRDCNKVFDLKNPPRAVSEEYLVNLQSRILENSESYEIEPGMGKIHFFPFEFWMYRYIFSPERAIQIYKELLVPMSTPLTNMWKSPTRLEAIPEENVED
jgi:Fe-S-cluster containining protein